MGTYVKVMGTIFLTRIVLVFVSPALYGPIVKVLGLAPISAMMVGRVGTRILFGIKS